MLKNFCVVSAFIFFPQFAFICAREVDVFLVFTWGMLQLCMYVNAELCQYLNNFGYEYILNT
jgi:hypothetical protein